MTHSRAGASKLFNEKARSGGSQISASDGSEAVVT